jgi:glyoxylase-like metal-dependent hydrolase (beta-lactamase superfamily II)
MQRLALAILAVAGLAWAGHAQAQQDFSRVEITTADLGHKTYMLEGAGGNITVAVGDDGVIMVDSQFAPMHDKIKAAVAALSNQPIKYVVNTHYHGDHTGGDEAFAKDGATVIAQENVRKRLAEGTTNGLTGSKTAALTGMALPGQTYKQSMTLKVKGRTAVVRHVNNAHTDGDTYVYFADANVIATGDVVTLGRYPNIDFANGGSIRGMIASVDAYLKLTNNNTKFVPGHGALATRASVSEYRTLLVSARDRIAKLIAAGKSEQDAIAARPMADYDAKFAANEQTSANFVRVVYNSLVQQKAANAAAAAAKAKKKA